MKGWVYVVSNKAMPGLVKVGYSMKDPELRAAELNHTGSPHPYLVDYEALVENPHKIEQSCHRKLAGQREGKEWFRCTPEEAIVAIKSLAGSQIMVENYKRANRQKAEEIKGQVDQEEQTKRNAEWAKRQHETALEKKRRDVDEKYKPLLLALIPNYSYWGYFFWVFLSLLIIIASMKPKMGGGGIFFLAALLSFGITHFLKSYFEERAKSSNKYKALLAKRDEQLRSLE